MYNTSKKSYVQELDFHFLTPKSLGAIYGDVMTQKLKKTDIFGCNCVISSHRIQCNTYIESFYEGLNFFFLHLMSYE